MLRRYEVADDQWSRAADLFPSGVGKRGRRFADPRTMLNAVFWVLHAGSPWRDPPGRYGPWRTAYDRFRRWRTDGTFDRLLAALRLALDAEGRGSTGRRGAPARRSSAPPISTPPGRVKGGVPASRRTTRWAAARAGSAHEGEPRERRAWPPRITDTP
ncbi:MAG TPA: transposase [Tepidisphaeraceae bacterium]|nr:transposase [Tepidisphaeraceae bacterium]